MAKRTYKQDPVTSKFYEVFRERSTNRSAAVHDDIKPFISTIDGSVINSKSDMREHNRRNKVNNDQDYIKEITESQRKPRTPDTGTVHERKLAIADAIERVSSSGFHRHVQYED